MSILGTWWKIDARRGWCFCLNVKAGEKVLEARLGCVQEKEMCSQTTFFFWCRPFLKSITFVITLLLFYVFSFFGTKACWILAPWPGNWVCVGRWSLNHQIAREVSHIPLLTLRMWCLSRDQPPRLEGSSSNPWRRAVLFSHRMRLGQVSYSKPTETERYKGVGQSGRWESLLDYSEPSSRNKQLVLTVIQIQFKKLTQGGRLIAFLLVIPYNIKFKFQAELNLETFHRSCLWGWKDLSNEQPAFQKWPQWWRGKR